MQAPFQFSFPGLVCVGVPNVSDIEEVSRLAARDRNWLLDPVENPPKPNAKPKAGKKKRYKNQARRCRYIL
jgi:hypothetical protein